MIERYSRPPMSRVWSSENKLDKWLTVELLSLEALAESGQVPREAVDRIRAKARCDLKRMEEIEREVRHDVIAFLTAVGEHVGEDARYLHYGMTSSDILDTGLALQLGEAADLILHGLERLAQVLQQKAFEHQYTVIVGRTHGVHAEPTTLGLKLASWYQEAQRNSERMGAARERIRYGKVSGAVGTYAHLSPFVEQYVCEKAGLRAAPISSQILQRDRHAELMTTLAILAGSLEKIALEVRHLQRTEVGEVEELFGEGQKGSSAMPHKRNPITAEQICGLARLVRSYALASLENIALWHERDISHSSVERVILPDSTILIDYMLDRSCELINGLRIDAGRMQRNLQLTRGQVFSQGVMLKLIRHGLSREEAYRLVQRRAMAAWREGTELQAAMEGDEEIGRTLSPTDLADCFELKYHTQYVDEIFQRVFSRKKRSAGEG